MICVDRNEIYRWAPRSDMKTSIYVSGDHAHFQFGPYKGNPSNDGNRLAVRARNGVGALVVFVYDIAASKKYPDIDLDGLPGKNSYCTISASGRYLFCVQKMRDETDHAYVFSVDGRLVQHWAEHHRPGHGDIALDIDGNDVYVGISKANPDKYHVIKRRLRDGAVTDLAPYGEAQHVSVRNINRPGWAFVTYGGSYSQVAAWVGRAPFYQEVVAIRIDGGEVRRIVQTRSAAHDYWSEAHGSPSPDGSQVIWSSNWGRAGGAVADYVARLGWPATAPGVAVPAVQ